MTDVTDVIRKYFLRTYMRVFTQEAFLEFIRHIRHPSFNFTETLPT